GFYFKQNWNDGLVSTRQIAIDGKVPYKELLLYKFDYDTAWHFNTFSDENGEPFLFYLEEGVHTITMTVKMGDMGPILDSVMEDISVLSDMLLKITMLAGDSPDPNYDYRFFQKIPDLPDQMQFLVDSLTKKYEMAKGLATKTPAMANNFLTVRAQIQSMLDDPFSIAKKMGDLTSSQESLSNWYLTLQTNPLVIDRFEVGSPSEKWKDKSSNLFQKIKATMTQFLSSFTKDYDNVGGLLDEDVEVKETINVWIARGTEWAEVIKEMADGTFTPKTGIAINVNVLPASQLHAGNVNALMLSITSGKAPDVALGVDVTSPVEFAIRDQVYDLSQMEGFEEVKAQFVPATLTPYEYMGGTFAIPETMNFNVLFYRKDILAQNGIDLPNTRADLYDYVLPALYQQRLEFYFGRDFTQFLFQNGGDFYTEDGMRSALDTPEAYQAFKEYTELFTNYGVPKTANFYQRLRSGIAALGVGDFNTYMQLSVAAPEISGKWGIAPLPGVLQSDGQINRAAGAITEKGDIIMKQSKKPKESWEFLKWWSSAEVQSAFAKEVEALMGAEARWNTANKEAFLSLDWDDEDISTLEEQWKWAKETPTLLGSYMTTRHLTNAWTTVVISGGNVREALEQAVKDINREMRSKQEEYGVIADEQ
ncbi:MAG: extracellular solute-binding protein, partial [Lachnospiraceae bacterium]|nr:extracellular solute-binding protein [Lachnospiraceae bacterium]